MTPFPEFQKNGLNYLNGTNLSFHPQDLFDLGLDSEFMEMDRVFSEEKKSFSEYMTKALSEGEDRDLNSVALRFISAWAKNQTEQILDGKRKGISKPGTLKDAFSTLKSKHQQLVAILKKVWASESTPLTPQEESCLVNHLKCDSENFKEFITTCSLYDTCFYNQYKGVIQAAMDEFKKDIPFFVEWLHKENRLLSVIVGSDEKEKPQALRGINHIAQNYLFAESVLKNIPPECWTNDILLSLGRWVVSDTASTSFIRDFARKLEKCPSDKIRDYFDFLSDFTEMNTDCFQHFSYKGVMSLLSSFKEEKAIKEAQAFYEKSGSIIFNEKEQSYTLEDWKKMSKFLSKTKVGTDQLINISMSQSDPLVWRLFTKGDLDKEDLERILHYAMQKDRRDFLMMKKPVHFSNEFPCYSELKEFFKEKSSSQGTRFFKSFLWQGVSSEQQCKLMKDFVSSKAINFYYAQKLNLFNQWAKNNSGHEILTYCYGKNVDTDPQLKIPMQDLKKLFSKQDEEGKTPWHYICQKKDRDFFNRRLKELLNSFGEVCLIPDHSGKTPLDYASEDPKFVKKISEKNTEISKKMVLAGISTDYVPVKKVSEPVVEKTPVVKLAPKIPVVKNPMLQMGTSVQQQQRIKQGMSMALAKHQNLILKSPVRSLGLTYGVLREINEDTFYKQDIVEHLQKLITTEEGKTFLTGGAPRWKPFHGYDGIFELSISPKIGHSQAMPRVYFKKEFFKSSKNTFEITSQKDSELLMWVGCKKGDKRDQCNDANTALSVRFKNDGLQNSGPVSFNDLDWYCCDMVASDVPPQKLPPLPQNGGR